MELVSIYSPQLITLSLSLHDSLKLRAPRRLCSPAPRLLQVPSLFHDSFQRGECVCRTLVPSCPRVNAAESNIGSSRHLSLGPRCHQEGQLSCFASSRQIPESRACLHGQSTRNGKGGQARNRAIWDFSRQRAGNFSVARVRHAWTHWHENVPSGISRGRELEISASRE